MVSQQAPHLFAVDKENACAQICVFVPPQSLDNKFHLFFCFLFIFSFVVLTQSIASAKIGIVTPFTNHPHLFAAGKGSVNHRIIAHVMVMMATIVNFHSALASILQIPVISTEDAQPQV